MQPSDELRYDHDVLRGKLYQLEEHLPCLSIARLTLSSVTDSLSAWLLAHAAREERLLASRALHEHPLTEMLARLQADHDHQLARLALLHRLLARSGPVAYEQVIIEASMLMQDLREHMTQEERECFPLIDQADDEEPAQFFGVA